VIDEVRDYIDAALDRQQLKLEEEQAKLREALESARRSAEESAKSAETERQLRLEAEASAQKFGQRSSIAASAAPHVDAVEFGVSYPRSIQVSVPFLVDAWVFSQDEREAVAVRATQLDGAFRSGGAASVARRSTLSVGLEIDSCDVRPASQKIHWTGNSANVSFAVSLRNAISMPNLIGTCSFSFKGLRLGQVLFELSLTPLLPTRRIDLRL
jgi:hypothetical protein